MKTMMELLISLQLGEHSVQLARGGRQLSPLEERFAQRHLDLVREIIPAEVLALYYQMKKTNSDLLSDSPELFAMSVLVATYRSSTPSKRNKFVNHFATQPSPQPTSNGHADNRPGCARKRRVKATRRQLPGRN